MEQAQQETAQQNLQASGADQAAQAQSQEPLGAAADLENQEFFVPLKQIGSVQKNALAEATAMAKRKGDNFELVVNIQRFTPEEVKVYIAGQSVVVQAKHVDAEGLVTDSYEQKGGNSIDFKISGQNWGQNWSQFSGHVFFLLSRDLVV